MRLVALTVLLGSACSRPSAPVAVADPAERPKVEAAPEVHADGDPDSRCAPQQISTYEMAVRYCAAVADACCGNGGGWVCNNARYIEWYLERCPNRPNLNASVAP